MSKGRRPRAVSGVRPTNNPRKAGLLFSFTFYFILFPPMLFIMDKLLKQVLKVLKQRVAVSKPKFDRPGNRQAQIKGQK